MKLLINSNYGFLDIRARLARLAHLSCQRLSLVLAIAVMAMQGAAAQTTLYQENFTSFTQLPPGWSQGSSPAGNLNTWTIGGSYIGPYNGPFYNGSNLILKNDTSLGLPTNAKSWAELPTQNFATRSNVGITFKHFFAKGSDGRLALEAHNGSAWQEVFSIDSSNFAIRSTTINLSALLGGSPSARLRFVGSGRAGRGVYIDDIVVFAPSTAYSDAGLSCNISAADSLVAGPQQLQVSISNAQAGLIPIGTVLAWKLNGQRMPNDTLRTAIGFNDRLTRTLAYTIVDTARMANFSFWLMYDPSLLANTHTDSTLAVKQTNALVGAYTVDGANGHFTSIREFAYFVGKWGTGGHIRLTIKSEYDRYLDYYYNGIVTPKRLRNASDSLYISSQNQDPISVYAKFSGWDRIYAENLNFDKQDSWFNYNPSLSLSAKSKVSLRNSKYINGIIGLKAHNTEAIDNATKGIILESSTDGFVVAHRNSVNMDLTFANFARVSVKDNIALGSIRLKGSGLAPTLADSNATSKFVFEYDSVITANKYYPNLEIKGQRIVVKNCRVNNLAINATDSISNDTVAKVSGNTLASYTSTGQGRQHYHDNTVLGKVDFTKSKRQTVVRNNIIGYSGLVKFPRRGYYSYLDNLYCAFSTAGDSIFAYNNFITGPTLLSSEHSSFLFNSFRGQVAINSDTSSCFTNNLVELRSPQEGYGKYVLLIVDTTRKIKLSYNGFFGTLCFDGLSQYSTSEQAINDYKRVLKDTTSKFVEVGMINFGAPTNRFYLGKAKKQLSISRDIGYEARPTPPTPGAQNLKVANKKIGRAHV